MWITRRPLAAVLLVAAVVAALVSFAGPASANEHCVPGYPGAATGVCVITAAGGYATAEIRAVRNHNFHSPTVALEMCSVGPSNCGIISSASDIGHIWTQFSTSKPYSPGHIYRAIGSWTDQYGSRHTAVSTGYIT